MYLTVILLLLTIFGFIEVSRNRRYTTLTLLFILLFFCLSAFRWERGTDWITYYEVYQNPYIFGDGAFEIGYFSLNLLFGQILGLDYSFFLAFLALIIYSLIWVALKRDCYYILFSLLCLYVTLGNGGIFFVRQTIAASAIFFSFHYVKEKKPVKFIWCILLAASFHRASLIALPVYFLYNLKINAKQMKYIVICGSILMIISSFGFFDRVLSRFSFYQEVGNEKFTLLQYYVGTANKLVYLLVFLIFKPSVTHSKQLSDEVNGLLKIYIYGVFLYVFFGSMNITLSRLANFVNIFIVYQISIWLNYRAKADNRRLLALVFVFLFVFRSLFSVSEYQDLFVPYKSIFNKNLPVSVY